MSTASVQDIDSFIRLQKEKLSREKNATPSGFRDVFIHPIFFHLIKSLFNIFDFIIHKANQLDYHAQLENYMKLTTINNNSNEQLQNQIYFNQSPQQVNFNPSPQFQPTQNYQAPPYANIPQQQKIQPTQSNSQNQKNVCKHLRKS